MGLLTYIRDEVYLRIGVKQGASSFYFANDFVLEKTWRPWETLENLFDADKYPSGKVYVIGGRPGDLVTTSRANATAPRDYPVHVGFQHKIVNIADQAEVDNYVNFVEELEETLRLEIDNNELQFAFSRIEPIRDPNGVPLSFVLARESNLFEAYFTAFFVRPLEDSNISTTTTTTT